jgi:hypothetical protein
VFLACLIFRMAQSAFLPVFRPPPTPVVVEFPPHGPICQGGVIAGIVFPSAEKCRRKRYNRARRPQGAGPFVKNKVWLIDGD